jgi:transposase
LGRRSPYPPEFRRDAVELVRTSGKPVRQTARELGISSQTLRNWVKQDRVDRGHGAPGEVTTADREELRRLRRENTELRLEREILKKPLRVRESLVAASKGVLAETLLERGMQVMEQAAQPLGNPRA